MNPFSKTIQFSIMHLYKMDADAVNFSSLSLRIFLSGSSVGSGGSVGLGVTGGSVGLGVSIGAGCREKKNVVEFQYKINS